MLPVVQAEGVPGEEGARVGGRPARVTKKRPADVPITPEVVAAYLAEYAWLRNHRNARERLAYRIVERLADEMAYRRVQEAGKKVADEAKWQRRVEK